MLQPYHLTIRFRQHANDALLDLETDDGAADVATFVPPFGDDLPLVLRALDWAQFPPGARPPWLFDADAQARLTALGLWEGRRPAEDIHARVGRALYAALNVEPAATIIQQARASARANGQPLELVLRFARSSAALADLPWEALWEDAESGGLPLLLAQGSRSSCVRYLSLPRPAPSPRPPGRALTLLAVSPHAGIPEPLLREQRDALSKALQPQLDSQLCTLIMPEPPLTPVGLLELVRQHQPDILSFYGHGEWRDGQGYLLFDAPNGGQEWVAANRLAPLADSGLRMLMLHACRSSQHGGDTMLSGVAGLLSSLGLPIVLAMQSYIRITAATRFQSMICRAIAEGQSVQEALAWARAVVYAEERDAASWYVPTLMIASRNDAPLLLIAPPNQTMPSDLVGAQAMARAGIRRASRLLSQSGAATSGSMLTRLAAGALLALFAADFSEQNVRALLSELGERQLADWAMAWLAVPEHTALVAQSDELQALQALANDLDQAMQRDVVFADAIAQLIERTAAIPAALDGLAMQIDRQTDMMLDVQVQLRTQEALLTALRNDLRETKQHQGHLNQVLLQALDTQTERLLKAYAQASSQHSQEIQTVLQAVRALHDEVRALIPQPSLPPQTNIGGDVVMGDKVMGDKVMGDKVVYNGPTSPPLDAFQIGKRIMVLQRRLAMLREQASKFAPNVPQSLQREIDMLQAEIARLQALGL